MFDTENVDLAMKVAQMQAQRLLLVHQHQEHLEEEQERIDKEQERLVYNERIARSALNHACVSASKAWCWDFTSKMVARLPRELRDLVYDYFLNVNSHRLSIRHFDSWDLGRRYPALSTDLFLRGPFPPFFAYPTCVHPTFALEVSEALHRSAIFCVRNAALLGELLGRDVISTTCTPRDYIRRIEIELRITESHPHKNDFNECVAHLPELLRIKQVERLQVRFVLNSRNVLYIHRIEEVAAPIVHALKAKGAIVTWSEIDDNGDIRRDLPVRKRNFSCTLQELEDDIKTNTVFNASGY